MFQYGPMCELFSMRTVQLAAFTLPKVIKSMMNDKMANIIDRKQSGSGKVIPKE
jgi:hypothetical protein